MFYYMKNVLVGMSEGTDLIIQTLNQRESASYDDTSNIISYGTNAPGLPDANDSMDKLIFALDPERNIYV